MDTENELAAIADRNPDDVEAQLKAAYSLDKSGDERRALNYYEAALVLTIPENEKTKFSVCYGSTLSNNMRLGEAIHRLEAASTEHPENSEIKVFLSLALRKADRIEEAYAVLLKAIILEAGEAGLGGFGRAVAEYLEEIDGSVNSARP